ncbi:MAG: hypothetical protein Q7S89_01495 [bacterium]|nr:hypothetical protein [bacterium]
MIRLVASGTRADHCAYEVKRHLDEIDGMNAFCFMGSDMCHLGQSSKLDAELVVMFFPTADENHPAFVEEQSLFRLMASTKTPCVIVYGLGTKSYIDAVELDVLASCVPTPPIHRPVRADDAYGKHCYFYDSPGDVASVIVQIRHEAMTRNIDEAAQ